MAHMYIHEMSTGKLATALVIVACTALYSQYIFEQCNALNSSAWCECTSFYNIIGINICMVSVKHLFPLPLSLTLRRATLVLCICLAHTVTCSLLLNCFRSTLICPFPSMGVCGECFELPCY